MSCFVLFIFCFFVYLFVLFFFFFFSSRRRHTRSLCDWSSDVCSSDLYAPSEGTPKHPLFASASRSASTAARADLIVPAERSEERRVGKECRSRWSRYQ